MKRCELCKSVATIYCESDQASLCCDCDAMVHSANFLVAKHSRTLLCHVCQSPTPWNASGARLGNTLSICQRCVDGCKAVESGGGEDEIHMEDNELDELYDQDDEDEGDRDSDDDEEEEEEGEGENQLVPRSSTRTSPATSSTRGEDESSSRFFKDEGDRDSDDDEEEEEEEEGEEGEGENQLVPRSSTRTSPATSSTSGEDESSSRFFKDDGALSLKRSREIATDLHSGDLRCSFCDRKNSSLPPASPSKRLKTDSTPGADVLPATDVICTPNKTGCAVDSSSSDSSEP